MSVEQPVAARITSIDALRGLTIAFMILVNDPGDWAHVYRQLDHATWNGWTLTDLVFPTFLFLIGCSIVFSIDSRVKRGVPKARLALQILRRSLTIELINLAITVYPHFHFARMRLFGVLPRIALCYLIAGLIYLYVGKVRWLVAIGLTLLLGYWILMRWVPVPGLGWPVHDFPLLDPDRNLTAWIDRGFNAWTQHYLHTGRLYEKTRDPEGLLSTLPSVATVLIGILAARWMRRPETESGRRNGLLAAGAISLALGEFWNLWFPINKKLWTSSYVLMAAGLALLALGIGYWWLDVKRVQDRSRAVRAMIWPMLVYGSNAIVAFAFSEFVVKTLGWWKIPTGDDDSISAWGWTYAHLFARHGSNENTSIAFALAFVLFCFLPNWFLWRKKIFLRV